MIYQEFALIDHGFDAEGHHLGVTGYPDAGAVDIRFLAETPDRTRVFVSYEGPNQGGTDVAEADVLALLVADYGRDPSISLVDGVPVEVPPHLRGD